MVTAVSISITEPATVDAAFTIVASELIILDKILIAKRNSALVYKITWHSIEDFEVLTVLQPSSSLPSSQSSSPSHFQCLMLQKVIKFKYKKYVIKLLTCWHIFQMTHIWLSLHLLSKMHLLSFLFCYSWTHHSHQYNPCYHHKPIFMRIWKRSIYLLFWLFFRIYLYCTHSCLLLHLNSLNWQVNAKKVVFLWSSV